MLYSQIAEREQVFPIGDSKLYDRYNRLFEIIAADTPVLQEKAYRLRYQIYCCENQFETPGEHPNQLEVDAYDCRSVQSLIIYQASGEAIGTVRLILPDPDSPDVSFPIQKVCSHSLPTTIPMSSTGEISRFAISKKIRKMPEADLPKDLKCGAVLGLMKAIVRMSLEYGITDWLAVMEPSLLRLLRRFGIYFAPVGPLIEYHGVRQPCHVNLAKILGKVRQENSALWKFVTGPRSLTIAEEAIAANLDLIARL